MSTTVDNIKFNRGTVYLHEFLKLLSKTVDRSERIELIKLYCSNPVYMKGLRAFAECIYHPAVKFNLPEGPVEFKHLDTDSPDQAYATLFNSIKNIKYLCYGKDMIMNKLKREAMFIQMLESLCPDEAKIMIMFKDKKVDKRIYPLIDESIFVEAFPNWFPSEEDSKN